VIEDAPAFPFEEDLSADSAPEFARLRSAGPLTRVRLPDGHLAWLLLRRTDIKIVLTDQRFSRAAATRPGAPGVGPVTSAPGMLLGLDPPEHTRVRRLVSKAFTPRTIERKRAQVRYVVDDLLDRLQEHGAPADLVPAFTRPLPLRVIAEILGVPYGDRDQFQHLVAIITSASAHTPGEVAAALDELLAYLADLVARKRAEPGADLLSELIAARDEDDRLSERELLMNAHLILVAGHDTTANQLANSLVALFRHPDQLDLLRRRPELTGGAVEELLRFVQLETSGSVRIATEDVQLSGVWVRAGEAVLPLGHVASNDPEVYAEPRRLDITRTDAPPHMVFGHGPHHCPGAALARMELHIALSTLLARLPGLSPAVPLSDLRWRPGMVMRNIEELSVTWTAHP
jgi:cytochrome P450